MNIPLTKSDQASQVILHRSPPGTFSMELTKPLNKLHYMQFHGHLTMGKTNKHGPETYNYRQQGFNS
jgi:hypothetical protein